MKLSARLSLIVAAFVRGFHGLFAAAVYAINLCKQPGQDWMVN